MISLLDNYFFKKSVIDFCFNFLKKNPFTNISTLCKLLNAQEAFSCCIRNRCTVFNVIAFPHCQVSIFYLWRIPFNKRVNNGMFGKGFEMEF